MPSREKEDARQPFLHGADDDDSGDDSVELPELNHSNTHHNAPISSPDHSTSLPTPPKKPATYAILFMLGAQIFSASMNVSIRLLENAATHLHPLQVRVSPAESQAYPGA